MVMIADPAVLGGRRRPSVHITATAAIIPMIPAATPNIISPHTTSAAHQSRLTAARAAGALARSPAARQTSAAAGVMGQVSRFPCVGERLRLALDRGGNCVGDNGGDFGGDFFVL